MSSPVDATVAKAGTFTMGVEYSSDYEQAMKSLGFSGLGTGDIPALVNTAVAELNKRGGLLGWTVKVVFHNTSTAQASSDPSTARQAVCADFLQDHHVDFVLSGVALTNDCFVQHRVPVVVPGIISPVGSDDGFLRPRSPYLYVPSSFKAERFYALYVERLAAQGYFPSAAKIGVLLADDPSEQRQSKLLIDLLHKRKVMVAETFAYSTSNDASTEADISSAVLRFQTNGVTHVIGLDGNVGLFALQAEQQQYRPRYAMNTYLGPTSVQALVVPAAQLKGAVGVGWEPVNDVDAAHDDFRSAGRTACEALVKRSGQTLTDRSAQFIAYSVCDALQILELGVQRSRGFDPAGWRVGLGSLGTAFPTALNVLGSYSPSISTGASGVRDLRYDEGCSCFRYASKEIFR